MPEPTVIEQPKIAAEAVLGKEAVAGGPARTPDQLLADRLRSEIAKDIAPHQVLEGIAPHPAPNPGEIHRINNEGIGIKRFDTGPNAGEKDYSTEPRSEELRNKAEVSSRIAREILDKGYDGIKDDDAANPDIRDPKNANQKKQILIGACIVAAKAWPEGKAVFDNLTPAEQKAKVEAMFLRNPQALKLLSERFGEVYSEGNIPKDLVSVAQDEFERADKINKAKEEALETLKERLKAIEVGEKKFLPGTMDYDALVRLRGDSAGWDTRRKDMQEEIVRLELEIKNLTPKAEKDSVQEADILNEAGNKIAERRRFTTTLQNETFIDQISKNEARLASLRADVKTIDLQQGKLKGYEDEIARLNKDRLDLKAAEVPLIEESANAELAFKTAKRNLDVAKAARAVDEEKFVNDVTSMFQESAMRYMKQEVGRYEAAQAKIAAKESATAQKGDEANIMKWMENAWRKEGKNGKRNKVNKDEVKADYNHMLGERNVDFLIKEFMEPSFVEIEAKYGVGSVEAQEERKRLDDRYKDEAFMQKMGGIVSERLFKNYLESGGKIDAGDASVLVETTWGRAAIDRAIASNKETDDLVDKLRKENAFSGSKTEFVKAIIKNPTTYKVGGYGALGILALLFGAPFLAAGLGLAHTGYEAVAGAAGVSTIV